ncbi:hypothetical protein DCAR_0207407 [Daucus carota subsp. sativus]|uniref:Uncharacterized protein n=1 Tax=Daucus carota subsp. sativus TaxID=79200 RepID=A0A175Y973_DAUCS|nr:hypothetical protein DCAR_0207407 [Daucus carota subsp. sativus]
MVGVDRDNHSKGHNLLNKVENVTTTAGRAMVLHLFKSGSTWLRGSPPNRDSKTLEFSNPSIRQYLRRVLNIIVAPFQQQIRKKQFFIRSALKLWPMIILKF